MFNKIFTKGKNNKNLFVLHKLTSIIFLFLIYFFKIWINFYTFEKKIPVKSKLKFLKVKKKYKNKKSLKIFF